MNISLGVLAYNEATTISSMLNSLFQQSLFKEHNPELVIEIVEDVARSVDEQISLFQEASVIVTPHGAGLTNLLWCEPGTKVFELFYGGYKKAGYYYICKILGLEYSCIVDNTTLIDHFVSQYHDMTINIEIFKRELDRILNGD